MITANLYKAAEDDTAANSQITKIVTAATKTSAISICLTEAHSATMNTNSLRLSCAKSYYDADKIIVDKEIIACSGAGSAASITACQTKCIGATYTSAASRTACAKNEAYLFDTIAAIKPCATLKGDATASPAVTSTAAAAACVTKC